MGKAEMEGTHTRTKSAGPVVTSNDIISYHLSAHGEQHKTDQFILKLEK